MLSTSTKQIRHWIQLLCKSMLYPCLAVNVCTQYMNDIGIGVQTFEEFFSSLRQVFSCIRKSGLKLSPKKCQIGTTQVTFLGIQPETENVMNFLSKLIIPQTTKQVKLIGFVQTYHN